MQRQKNLTVNLKDMMVAIEEQFRFEFNLIKNESGIRGAAVDSMTDVVAYNQTLEAAEGKAKKPKEIAMLRLYTRIQIMMNQIDQDDESRNVDALIALCLMLAYESEKEHHGQNFKMPFKNHSVTARQCEQLIKQVHPNFSLDQLKPLLGNQHFEKALKDAYEDGIKSNGVSYDGVRIINNTYKGDGIFESVMTDLNQYVQHENERKLAEAAKAKEEQQKRKRKEAETKKKAAPVKEETPQEAKKRIVKELKANIKELESFGSDYCMKDPNLGGYHIALSLFQSVPDQDEARQLTIEIMDYLKNPTDLMEKKGIATISAPEGESSYQIAMEKVAEFNKLFIRVKEKYVVDVQFRQALCDIQLRECSELATRIASLNSQKLKPEQGQAVRLAESALIKHTRALSDLRNAKPSTTDVDQGSIFRKDITEINQHLMKIGRTVVRVEEELDQVLKNKMAQPAVTLPSVTTTAPKAVIHINAADFIAHSLQHQKDILAPGEWKIRKSGREKFMNNPRYFVLEVRSAQSAQNNCGLFYLNDHGRIMGTDTNGNLTSQIGDGSIASLFDHKKNEVLIQSGVFPNDLTINQNGFHERKQIASPSLAKAPYAVTFPPAPKNKPQGELAPVSPTNTKVRQRVPGQ